MSIQPSPIILGPRVGARADDAENGDLGRVLARVMAILSHRRWLFAIPLLAGMAFSLSVALCLPRQYQVKAIIERRDDEVLTKLVSYNSPTRFETVRRSIRIDLAGYEAIRRAADELGLLAGLPRDANGALTPHGEAMCHEFLSNLASQLTVGTIDQSTYLDLIEIRYAGDDPEMAVRLIRQLKDNYIAQTQNFITETMRESEQFFEDKVRTCREQVARMQVELLQIEAEQPGISPNRPSELEDLIRLEIKSIEELTGRKAQVAMDLSGLEETLRQLAAREQAGDASGGPMPELLPLTATHLIPNPQRSALMAEMNNVRSQIADAKSMRQMKDAHPTVLNLREKLRQLQSEFERLPEMIEAQPAPQPASADRSGLPPIVAARQRVDREIEILRRNLASLEDALAGHVARRAELEAQRQTLPDRRKAYMQRLAALRDAQAEAEMWSGHLADVRQRLTAADENRGVRFSTVEEPRVPMRPLSPKLSSVLLVSAGVGMALGVAAVFLREVMDTTLRDPMRVSQILGIPVLEIVGRISVTGRRRFFSRRGLLPAVAWVQGVLVLVLGGLFYLSVERPRTYDEIREKASGVVASLRRD